MQHLLVVTVLCAIASSTSADVNSDAFLDTPDLLRKYGYPVEIHKVTTDDGYILTLHRIPYSSKSPAAANKPVAFLQHGLFCTSTDWIIMGPENSLGYLLADAGYDVWMGNARGTSYSQEHQSLSTTSRAYWDFSWHEMGTHDLPAVIDYVLGATGQNDLYYVGHSMGTTMFYVLTSEKPEYNAKIRHMISLAPIAYMGHTNNAFTKFISNLPGAQLGVQILELFGFGKVTTDSLIIHTIMQESCQDGAVTQVACSSIMFLMLGYDPDQLNTTMLPVILSHTPDTASMKTLAHYGQEIQNGGFKKWDYYLTNLFHYGRLTAPDYDLSQITVPLTLLYGENDKFGDATDVQNLNSVLKNSRGALNVPFPAFNHMDFLWAKDVKTLVNDNVISIIQNN